MVVIVLMILVLTVYGQVGSHSFNNYDDDTYITQNPQVLKGLTWEGVSWAFTTFHAVNWHPVTWLSHMADVSIFGLDAGWHHRINVLFHVLNTVILFFVFLRMTGALWQSAFVAALFGVHPLHVESVAWVAERKDILSTFFWMMTMGAYVRYVQRPGLTKYMGILFFYTLGLMCKPMLVTLPFVLLLLDYWPLRRFDQGCISIEKIYPLGLEKVPLFAMSLSSCVITYLAQSKGNALFPNGNYPIDLRASNAALSYMVYLGKMVWPVSLSVFYPHPGTVFSSIPAWQVLMSVLLLGGLSFLVIWQRGRRPYLVMGWLWYLGTLVPVIGLVQAGAQALADRYSYVPLIGVFVMVAWGIPAVLEGWRFRRPTLMLLGGAMLFALSAVAWNQAGFWKNNLTLFTHALNVTEKNWLAWNNVGNDYRRIGQIERAIFCFQEALRIKPDYPMAWYNLGVTYGELGQPQQAIKFYLEALRIWPAYAVAWLNLGESYANLGDHQRAIKNYQEALRVKPDFAEALFNIGLAYYNLGQPLQAITYYREALRIWPDFASAWYSLGEAYSQLGQKGDVTEIHQRLRRINPTIAETFFQKVVRP
jgi:tetratricopeptide (TPR) repeat protein